jgi:uncharacterized protein YnzC (UPF0291/DUF896 family)
MNTEALKSK